MSGPATMVWLAEQPDPGRSRAVALLAELAVLRRDFRPPSRWVAQ